MNKHFDELITMHLNGTLSEGEKQLLVTLLKVPENQLYLASQIDEAFFNESLKEEADDDTGQQILERIRKRIHQDLQQQVRPEDEQSISEVFHMAWYRKKGVRWMAAAAAAIILVISFSMLRNSNKLDEQSIVAQNDKGGRDSVLTVFHHEVNITGKEKRFQLQDGSWIELADKSEISYYEPFTIKRDITLKGKAFFEVAKDKTKPFTVTSGGISTTVLGTQFTVTAFEKASQITVRLFEGKVAIKRLKIKNAGPKDLVYLMPGEQFTYNDDGTYKVIKFNSKNNKPDNSGGNEVIDDNPSMPQNTGGTWYMFNNQSLTQVFDQLAILYNVKIVYNKKDIQSIYFTRRYNQSKTLENILKEIATLHHLTVVKQDSSFVISK